MSDNKGRRTALVGADSYEVGIDLHRLADRLGCGAGELVSALQEDAELSERAHRALEGVLLGSWANRETGRPRVHADMTLYTDFRGQDLATRWLEDVDITPGLELLTNAELLGVADPEVRHVDRYSLRYTVFDACVRAGVMDGEAWDGCDLSFNAAVECDYLDGIDPKELAGWEEEDWEDNLTDMGRYLEARLGLGVSTLYGKGVTPSAADVLASVDGKAGAEGKGCERGGIHARV